MDAQEARRFELAAQGYAAGPSPGGVEARQLQRVLDRRRTRIAPKQVPVVYAGVLGRADSVRVASRRAVRQQPDRGRSRPTQIPAETDARVTNRPGRAGDHRWTSVLQNLRRGHYELGLDSQPKLRIASALNELARVI